MFGCLVERGYDGGLLCAGARYEQNCGWDRRWLLWTLNEFPNCNARQLDRVLEVDSQNSVCLAVEVVPKVVY